MNVDLVVDAKATLGEGPVWHPREARLYWVDIERGELHLHDPDREKDAVYQVGCRVGVAVPRHSGGMMLATEFGFEAFDLAAQERTPIVDPESHLPDNRFNDGKCDARGGFWAGTLSMKREPGAAALYALETDHSVRRALEGVTTSNGLDWSPDRKTMYYIDTPTLQVAAFDYDEADGTIDNRRVVVSFPQGIGRPDGMTVDCDGMLWIAHWDGGRVSRWDPRTGTMLQEIAIPALNVTSCTFGGPELDRLYITTARYGLDTAQLEELPHSGGVFVVCPGAGGLPAHEYGG
jgi:sugar lactone lactonase YvrE